MSETSGEFISIGKGAIASEAINQQLADDPSLRLRFIQDTEGILDARAAGLDGGLEIEIDSLHRIAKGINLTELSCRKTDLDLDGVQLALEATPYGAHEELAKVVPYLRDRNIITVLASKGLLTEHPDVALPIYQAGYLGIDATLGGDTGIFPLFDEYSDDRTVAFEGVVNGTKARMLNLMRAGMPEEEIVGILSKKTDDNPKGEGLAEPGATTLLKIARGEHGDNLGKAINAYIYGVLVNDSKEISEEDIARVKEAEVYPIEQEHIDALSENPEDVAYVVNWHRDGGEIPPEYYDPSKVPGVFTLEVGASGLIVGAYRKLPAASPMHVITQRPGPLNGMAVTKKIKPGRDGWNTKFIFGTGAGPIPTAHRVVMNGRELREQHGLI